MLLVCEAVQVYLHWLEKCLSLSLCFLGYFLRLRLSTLGLQLSQQKSSSVELNKLQQVMFRVMCMLALLDLRDLVDIVMGCY